MDAPGPFIWADCFLNNHEQVFSFLKSVHDCQHMVCNSLEYYDASCLDFLRRDSEHTQNVKLPDDVTHAMYVEHAWDNDDDLDVIGEWYEKLFNDLGISVDDSWAGFDEKTLEAMRLFRHQYSRSD